MAVIVAPTIPLNDVALYTFLMIFFSAVLLFAFMALIGVTNYNNNIKSCIGYSDDKIQIKYKRIFYLIFFFYFICGIAGPIVMNSVCVATLSQYLSDARQYNSDVVDNALICNITSVEPLGPYNDYLAQYVLFNTTTIVGKFEGKCEIDKPCAPPVGRLIKCYQVGNQYTITSPSIDDYFIKVHEGISIVGIIVCAILTLLMSGTFYFEKISEVFKKPTEPRVEPLRNSDKNSDKTSTPKYEFPETIMSVDSIPSAPPMRTVTTKSEKEGD